MSEHAPYGGSTAARTENCPAWRKFVDTLPPQKSTSYADVGTLCHMAMQKIYTEDAAWDSHGVIGMEYEGHILDEALYESKISPAIDALESILDKYDIQNFKLEARVKLFDDAWGTADFLGRGLYRVSPPDGIDPSEDDWLVVGLSLDYKFGDGVMVDAENNRQGLFYAAGASVSPETAEIFKDIELLVIAIVQPTDRSERENFSVWEVDPDDLKQFVSNFHLAISNAEGENPTFSPGDHCQFCPGRGLCPPTSGEMQKAARMDLTVPDILERIPTFHELERIEKTCKAIRSLVHEQLEAGAIVKDYKMIPKRASRQYVDLAAAEKMAKNSRKLKRAETHTFQLLSPAQMEKLCKKKKLDYDTMFAPYIKSISSGTKLVASDDPRAGVPGITELAALLDRD